MATATSTLPSTVSRLESYAASWVDSRRKFIEAGGHTTQSFGLGRIIGQIFALLYLTPRPLCLDEIAAELEVSKASVSTTVRQLQAWTAVRQVWVKGDRKDYYEAETDFNYVLKNGLLEVVRKKLNTAGLKIDEVEAALTQAEGQAESGGGAAGDIVTGHDDAERKLIAERVQRAKELHHRLNEIIASPLLEQIF